MPILDLQFGGGTGSSVDLELAKKPRIVATASLHPSDDELILVSSTTVSDTTGVSGQMVGIMARLNQKMQQSARLAQPRTKMLPPLELIPIDEDEIDVEDDMEFCPELGEAFAVEVTWVDESLAFHPLSDSELADLDEE